MNWKILILLVGAVWLAKGSRAVGAEAETPDTLSDFLELRSQLRQKLGVIGENCQAAMLKKNPTAAGRLALHLQIGPEGRVTLELLSTRGYLNAEHLPTAAVACVTGALAKLQMVAPPAGRPVHLCVPVKMQPKGFCGMLRQKPSHNCERSFRVSEKKTDPMLLYKEKLAELTWRNEHQVTACLEGKVKMPLRLRWAIASNGRVAMVEVPKNLPAEVRRCVRRVVRRWVFAYPPDNKTFVMHHSFRAP